MSALDTNSELTELGRILARLPIEPILGKTLVLATACGVGELLATIAAASSFSTPFIPRERMASKLSTQQRSFAGTRHSDHIALISVFNQFRKSYDEGPVTEKNFCDRYSLSSTVLRMTGDAKRQLTETLISSGFPESLFIPLEVSAKGADSNLDLVLSMLVYALYPNVCHHRDKRRVYTLELATALMSKQSVNTPLHNTEEIKFPSPLFVFSEKLRTKVISCKQLSNITPLQLLIFGSRKVEFLGNDLIKLDDMIPLKMNVRTAARIVALRPCIEAFLVRTCLNPESAEAHVDEDSKLLSILKRLSSPQAWTGEDNESLAAEQQQQQKYASTDIHRGSYTKGGFRSGDFGAAGTKAWATSYGHEISGFPVEQRYRGPSGMGAGISAGSGGGSGQGYGGGSGGGTYSSSSTSSLATWCPLSERGGYGGSGGYSSGAGNYGGGGGFGGGSARESGYSLGAGGGGAVGRSSSGYSIGMGSGAGGGMRNADRSGLQSSSFPGYYGSIAGGGSFSDSSADWSVPPKRARSEFGGLAPQPLMDELNPRGAGDGGAGGGYGYGGGSGYGPERTEPRYLASSGRAAAAAAPGSGRSGAWWRNSAGVNDYGNFF